MLSKGQKIQYTKGAATFKNAHNDALKNTLLRHVSNELRIPTLYGKHKCFTCFSKLVYN